MAEKKIALVVGAGPGLGGALCRRFAREGFTIVGLRRRHGDELAELAGEVEALGGEMHGWEVDVRDEDAVITMFARVEEEIGPIEVVVFNPGANIHFPIRETTSQKFRKVWEMACFAGFLVGREAARVMVPRARGTILFTGATASVRGGAGFSAFASAKHGLRALAQSMARELGPEGIHVGHIVIDGGIEGAFIRATFGAELDKRGPDAILQTADIAETYWALHAQPRSAWSFETDLRPWLEPW
jgi:NAD(P)-dependent dehydrogenase (short-subunit alcohol dehydrogenase family)